MKKLLFFILLFARTFVKAQVSIETLRKEYYKLNTDSTACVNLFKKVSSSTNPDNLFIGYKGAVTASMANYVNAKGEKLKLFNTGRRLIDQSIAADSLNTELRFLRFTIQSNCPKALGYYQQIEPDKKYILAHLNSIRSPEQKIKMEEFLRTSKFVTEEKEKD